MRIQLSSVNGGPSRPRASCRHWLSRLNSGLLATLLSTVCLVPMSSADKLGVNASVGYWQPSIDGDMQSGSTRIDVNNTLGLDDESANIVSLAIEHPVPGLPNIRLQHTDLDFSEINTLDVTIDFEGETFNVTDTVSTELDLTHTDASFYYQVLDTVVAVDVGLTARWFQGDVVIRSLSTSASEELDVVIPLLYSRAGVDFPLTGLSAEVVGHAISYSGNSLIDVTAALHYELAIGLGIKAGIRHLAIELDDQNGVDADFDLSGGFAGLFFAW